jgi:Kef-type K+ transport system membrane component KefB
MNPHAEILIALGGILLLGITTDVIGKRILLPRVTLMLIFGVIIGEEALDLIPVVFTDHFELIAQIVLTIIGFILGGKCTLSSIGKSKKLILFTSLGAAFGTTIVVIVGLVVIGITLPIAILLGCIASATAPAATLDVISETNIKNPFSNLLLSVVALDDAWGLIIFSIGLAIVAALNGAYADSSPILKVLVELGGATILGIALGWIASFVPKIIKSDTALFTATIGLVLVCGGIAIWFEFSFLIASMVMGAMVANLNISHDRYFNVLENIQWPFLVVFFTVAGATLELGALKEIGLLGFSYIAWRIIGKLIGATVGSKLGKANKLTSRWIGVALLPQAGVAIGMALVAASQFPEYKQVLLSVVISTTVLFEIIGPIFTRLAVHKTSVVR